jgi:hypothetical protein
MPIYIKISSKTKNTFSPTAIILPTADLVNFLSEYLEKTK